MAQARPAEDLYMAPEEPLVGAAELISSLLDRINAGMTGQSCSPSSLLDVAVSTYNIQNQLFFSADSPSRKCLIPEFEAPGELLTSFEDLQEKFRKYFFLLDECSVVFTVGYDSSGVFRVGAANRETAAKLAKELAERYLEPIKQESEEKVKLGFWYATSNGPQRIVRLVDTPQLPELKRNYAAETWKDVETLSSLDKLSEDSGRIVLLHGPAGTGKTTMLRALARHWRKWASFDVVVDPEVLLGNAAYLMSAVSAEHHSYTYEEDEENSKGDKYRVLLLEDSGELVRGDAKDRTGQGISRLLNMADGILGRGTRCLFVISTNENLGDLHPAVVRPGRCLANIEFKLLSAQEASDWSGDKIEKPISLADLYARQADDPVLKEKASYTAMTGQYL